MAKRLSENIGETFEDRLKKLEGVLERLGEGETTLEGASKLYEEGMLLVKECRKMLKEVRGRVEKLDRATGRLEPLERAE